jgi:hypothetical protein
VIDMSFDAEAKTFIVVAQRLKREDGAAGSERICAALTVKGVASVQTHGIDLHQRERILNLLALIPETGDQSAKRHLSLIFAADVSVRLELGEWSAVIEDFGEPWPTLCRPCHEDTR